MNKIKRSLNGVHFWFEFVNGKTIITDIHPRLDFILPSSYDNMLEIENEMIAAFVDKVEYYFDVVTLLKTSSWDQFDSVVYNCIINVVDENSY